MSDMCTHIMETHECELDRQKDARKEINADQLNRILFVLTTGTFIFAPMQFLAGVFGMNFVDEETGKAGIPELLWKHGYSFVCCT
ncbi:unnamed protein product [Polarella glacialis]|uniref:Uncharacterized protein n=1 Tax=Polarella glacialis TaxID=89957 RepID=A0A813GZ61_POLGL|nr:unnamed protein product [Polarella glacialis]CAE8698347.1 unnamed protein product [Polarella glacialis]